MRFFFFFFCFVVVVIVVVVAAVVVVVVGCCLRLVVCCVLIVACRLVFAVCFCRVLFVRRCGALSDVDVCCYSVYVDDCRLSLHVTLVCVAGV